VSSLLLFVGIGAFFAALIASRRIKERAFTQLSDAEKLTLLDSFAGQRSLQLIPVAVMVMLYLGVSLLGDGSTQLITTVFWLGLGAYGLLSVGLSTLRLRSLDLPAHYLRSWLLGRALVFGGVLLMLGSVWAGGVR
jgi:hypothetical protein